MKTQWTVLVVVASIGTAALGFVSYTAKVENKTIVAHANADHAALTAQVLAKDQIIESQGAQIGQAGKSLADAAAELNQTKAKLDELSQKYEQMLEAQQKAEAIKNLLAQIPKPTIAITRNAAGAEEKIFMFPEVRDNNNNLRATNATFAKLSGRRLIFRPEEGVSIEMDVDEVHPAILAYLEIDVEKAKGNQSAADIAWERREISEHAQAVEQARLEQEAKEAQERIRIEQEKANAEIAKQNAQAQAIAEAAYNERMKAQAAKEQADAAMLDAGKPPVLIIQQQQQQQQPPTTFFSH